MIRQFPLLWLSSLDDGQPRHLDLDLVLLVDADDAGGDAGPLPLPWLPTMRAVSWLGGAGGVRRFCYSGWVGEVGGLPGLLVVGVVHAVPGRELVRLHSFQSREILERGLDDFWRRGCAV